MAGKGAVRVVRTQAPVCGALKAARYGHGRQRGTLYVQKQCETNYRERESLRREREGLRERESLRDT